MLKEQEMAVSKMPPPRVRSSPPASRPPSSSPRPIDRTAPPAPTASVVPIRPKPPAFASALPGPVVIEEDIVDYLIKAPIEQRWRILARVALATRDEPVPSSVPPAPTQRSLELVDDHDVTDAHEGAREDSRLPPPTTTPAPPPSVLPPAVSQSPAVSQPPATSHPPAVTQPPPVPQSNALQPPPVAPTASSAPDATEQLFEAMQELSQLEGAFAGVRFCLESALRAVPCLAGIAHVRDPIRRDLVVLHARGPRADALLGMHNSEGDSLVGRAISAGKPIAVVYGSGPGAETTTCARHAFFDPWGVILVPVLQGGQLLALLEMIDPISTSPSDDLAQSALAYVAERLGRFLVEQAP
jgi:hypothetical protein